MIPARHFYMIRHGETVANALQLTAGGGVDTPLNEKGRSQALAVSKFLHTLPVRPKAVIHSPLSRARDTATYLNMALGLPMHEVEDVREHRVGDWENVSWDIVMPSFDRRVDPPGGETHIDFAARVGRGIAEAVSYGEPAMIVCHGGVFRGFGDLYGLKIHGIRNCHLYEFVPADTGTVFPWEVYEYATERDGERLVSETYAAALRLLRQAA